VLGGAAGALGACLRRSAAVTETYRPPNLRLVEEDGDLDDVIIREVELLPPPPVVRNKPIKSNCR
jgi:hypothetical protein